jgi:hypothetical protein
MSNNRVSPEHHAAIEAMKDQLLIVLIKRLGGSADIPVAEIDNTGGDLLSFRLDVATRMFHFEVTQKETK